ncbi:MAG: hypothetical protein JST04_00190 [Bdellovibrionales bacterium]|nr:hypothetical protein [Bdellovibrionales bacterium]
MSKFVLLSRLAAALLAVSSVSAFADPHCGPGVSKEECARRMAQSARDKARNQQNQQNNNNNYGGGYNGGSNNTVDYRTGNQPKYGSAQEREQAKRDRKAARDRGETTTTTDVIYRKDGGTTVVTNTTNPYGQTNTQVNKYNPYGRQTQDKNVNVQHYRGTDVNVVDKRITDFGSRGNVRVITQERSLSYRNSSQYNTVISREQTYRNYRTNYSRYYQSPAYVSRGYHGGYYYDLRPVVQVDVYFSNPLVFWLFNSTYEDSYYRTYWGYDYQPFSAFNRAGVFYPTQDLIDLARDVAGMNYGNTANFRAAMQVLAEQLEAKLPGRLGSNDVVISHAEVVSANLAVVEGYVNTYGQPFSFKALLDLNNGYGSMVFVPSTWDRDPTAYDLYILDQINARIMNGY